MNKSFDPMYVCTLTRVYAWFDCWTYLWIILMFAEHSGQNFDEEDNDETLCSSHN